MRVRFAFTTKVSERVSASEGKCEEDLPHTHDFKIRKLIEIGREGCKDAHDKGREV